MTYILTIANIHMAIHKGVEDDDESKQHLSQW